MVGVLLRTQQLGLGEHVECGFFISAQRRHNRSISTNEALHVFKEHASSANALLLRMEVCVGLCAPAPA